ncbi:hypothetical protein Hanom_Chr16g01438681 [Helianthus anomalus]
MSFAIFALIERMFKNSEQKYTDPSDAFSCGSFALRIFFSYRIFVSVIFTLLFLATASVLFSSHPAHFSVNAGIHLFLLILLLLLEESLRFAAATVLFVSK